jgi:transposase
MPPQYVKAYVKRNKNDAADAEAICEAVKRPSMRFVPVKTIEQQSALLMHRARDLLIRQRTMLVNALRGHMFGITASPYHAARLGRGSNVAHACSCYRQRFIVMNPYPEPAQ